MEGPHRLSPRHAEQVDALFAPWDREGSPGAAVAVVREGRLVYARGYGAAHLEHRAPVTPETPFHVASVSKPFTALAVGLLDAEGALSWDDELRDHLPWVPDLGAPVTLRQLANHTSGVRDQWELLQLAGWRMDDVITRDQILRMMARQRELNFDPGTEHLYSNMGYSLLAEVVEEVSGQPFGAFLRERVFEPLGMDATHVHDDHTQVVPGRAYSYLPSRSATREDAQSEGSFPWRRAVLSYANRGATSLFTTAENLGLWLADLTDPTVVDPSVYQELVRPTALADGDTVNYGLGFILADHRGHFAAGHGGADAGFRAQVLHVPDEDLGVAVLANQPLVQTRAAALAVADLFLENGADPALDGASHPARNRMGEGHGHPPWKGENAPDPPTGGSQADGPSVDPGSLAPYEGTYYSPELDTVYRIRRQGTGLRLVPQRGASGLLRMTGNGTFRGERPLPMIVEFIRNQNGDVTGLRVSTARILDLRFQRIAPLPEPGGS